MEYAPFHQRFENLPELLGQSWKELQKKTVINLTTLSMVVNPKFSTIINLCEDLGLIPIAFYYNNNTIDEVLTDIQSDNYIGRVFAHVREMYGFTTFKVANSSGITSGQLTKYEQGKTFPRLNQLERVASFLSLAPHYLLLPESNPLADLETNTSYQSLAQEIEEERVRRKTKKKMGRPKLSNKNKMSERILLRLKISEMEAVQRAADAAGLTISAYARDTIVADVMPDSLDSRIKYLESLLKNKD